jgi:phospholipase/lecithinase/hemolysin
MFYRQALLGTLLTASLCAPAMAGYSQMIVFGDSLSDNGNLYALTQAVTGTGSPGVPYYEGRFSNGTVAVENMASTLGLGLTDYAYGGAQTGLGNIGSTALYGTGMAGQVSMFQSDLGSSTADTHALYVLWGGPNDFFAGTSMLSSSTATTASTNLLNDITALYNLGARDFFIPLMPDLSLTPAAAAANASYNGYKDAAALRTSEYNNLVLSGLNSLSLSLSGIQIQTFDTANFLRTQAQLLGDLGYNTTDACLNTSAGSVCSTPDTYLFWDGVHPTAAAHQLLGQAFAAAVPEASTMWMMALGLGLLGWTSKRRVH